MDPWELAHERAREAGVTLRPLDTVEDAAAIGRVIEVTWGGGQQLDREVIRALASSGNIPWGAFDDDALAGFVLGWAGVDHEGLHVHSHMLAAVPGRRHGGLGTALKLAQRAQALDQGIHVARWTFDPMVARNAWFNLGKLGAVIDRFGRDFYGQMSDEINAGDRSDRFFVRWNLDREPGPHPVAVPAGTPSLLVAQPGAEPVVAPGPPSNVTLVEVPAEYHDLRTADPQLGSRWRDAAADAFEMCLSAGLIGVAFLRERSAYLFARPEVAG